MPEAIREYRSYPLLDTKSDEGGKFSGYAATYKRDAYGDVIEPGAFEKTIKASGGKIPIFLNHDRDHWIGFSTEMAEDAKGLYLEAVLSLESSRGADAYALLKTAQSVNYRIGLSIGFIADKWELNEDGTRTLKAIDLWETSLTPFPANRGARVDSIKSLRNLEQVLRDVGGCSKEGAKRALAVLQPYLLSDGSGDQPSFERDARNLRHQFNDALRALK